MGEWASASYPAMVSHLLLKLTFLLKTDQNFSTTAKLNFTQQVFATICTICTNHFIMFHNMHKIFHTHHCPDEKNLSESTRDRSRDMSSRKVWILQPRARRSYLNGSDKNFFESCNEMKIW